MPSQIDSPVAPPTTAFRLASALAFVACFQGLFYTHLLFNSAPADKERLSRLDVLLLAIVPGPNNLYRALLSKLADTEHLDLRLPLLAAAGSIVLVAVGTGSLALRRLGIGNGLSGLERLVLAYAIGMAAISLWTQLLGLAGSLTRTIALMSAAVVGTTWIVVFVRSLRNRAETASQPIETGEPAKSGWGLPFVVLVALSPFLLLGLLGSLLPTPDYDALAYHLLGPKEWWLAGRIAFLPHNVYTTFPFLTEMFHLLGMVVMNDWFTGGLVGQAVLWTFAPMTGLGVGLLANRLFGRQAGWLAALVYLTTPWVYRLSIIPYVEGALLFYGVASVLAATAFGRWRQNDVGSGFVIGFLAGCGAACKYTGVLMTTLPAFGWLVFVRLRASRPTSRDLAPHASPEKVPLGNRKLSFWRCASSFSLGVAVSFGPWLVRNAVWTGNPVYPLAYGVFNGDNWSREKADKFAAAHRSGDFSARALWRYIGITPHGQGARDALGEIPFSSDWQSALVFCFAPLAFFGTGRRNALGLWALAAYLFAVFWLLTHRLDRFWLPLEPFAAGLAGAGIAICRNRIWTVIVGAACMLGVVYNLAYCSTRFCGLNDYTTNLTVARQLVSDFYPTIAVSNNSAIIPPNHVVLHIGFAAVYYTDPGFRYNTVFDDNLLEAWIRDPASPDGLLSAEAIRERFKREGIDDVLVDWNWIEQYRQPGNYGYTAFIRRELFDELVWRRVLERVDLYRVGPAGSQLAKVPLFPAAALPLDQPAAIELYRVVR